MNDVIFIGEFHPSNKDGSISIIYIVSNLQILSSK